MFCLHVYNFTRLKYLLVLALIFPLAACLGGGDGGSSELNDSRHTLDLAWVAPSGREDSTGLSLSEIAGYRIYYGTATGSYQNQYYVSDSIAVQAQITGVPLGTYYLVMTTIDTDGRESSYSPEVVVTL